MLNCVDAMDFVETLCGHTFYDDDAMSEERLSTPGRRTVSFSNKEPEIFLIDNAPEPFKVDCHSGEGLLHHLAATPQVWVPPVATLVVIAHPQPEPGHCWSPEATVSRSPL